MLTHNIHTHRVDFATVNPFIELPGRSREREGVKKKKSWSALVNIDWDEASPFCEVYPGDGGRSLVRIDHGTALSLAVIVGLTSTLSLSGLPVVP